MNNTLERKLFFYNFNVFKNINAKEIECDLKQLFSQYYKKIDGDYTNLKDRGFIYAPEKDEKMYFLEIKSINDNHAKCILYSLRNKALPHLFNLLNGQESAITDDTNDALMEQTHFIVYFSDNLIISEYNHFGARIESLRHLLTYVSKTILNGDISRVEISAILIPEEYRNLSDLKKIKSMTFNIGAIGSRLFAKEANLPISFDLENEFNNLDDLKIELTITGSREGIDFKNKGKILEAISRFIYRKKVSEECDSSDLSRQLNKSIIKANSFDNDKFIPINLLEDKLVKTVIIPKSKKDNSKYLDSDSIFYEIENSYNTLYYPLSDSAITLCSE